MSGSREASAGGVGVLGLLGVLFVGLKLTGFIDWSWWWVTAPFWAVPAFLVAALAVIGTATIVVALLTRKW